MVVIAWIIRILLILVSIGLVVLVTMQKAKQAGLGSLAGGDSFSLKGKSKGVFVYSVTGVKGYKSPEEE